MYELLIFFFLKKKPVLRSQQAGAIKSLRQLIDILRKGNVCEGVYSVYEGCDILIYLVVTQRLDGIEQNINEVFFFFFFCN